jgi:hypothetical protein
MFWSCLSSGLYITLRAIFTDWRSFDPVVDSIFFGLLLTSYMTSFSKNGNFKWYPSLKVYILTPLILLKRNACSPVLTWYMKDFPKNITENKDEINPPANPSCVLYYILINNYYKII